MLRPAKARFRGAVEVHALPNAGKEETGQILVRYEMNPELSRVARGAKLRWDHARTAYVRTVDECAMPLVDRAAEVCAKLLTAGFRVLALDASVREKALSGTYAREYPRWIRRGKNPFTLEFLYTHNPWLHERVRSLGARWSGQAMEVNWMLTEETQEFAQLYNCANSCVSSVSIQFTSMACPDQRAPSERTRSCSQGLCVYKNSSVNGFLPRRIQRGYSRAYVPESAFSRTLASSASTRNPAVSSLAQTSAARSTRGMAHSSTVRTYAVRA